MVLSNTKIPTASVVAILKVPEIDALILRGESFKNVLQFAKSNDFILFDSANYEIESFDHEVLTSEKGGMARNSLIHVTLIDPMFRFEKNLISVGFRALYGTNSRVFEEIDRLSKLRILKETSEAQAIRAKIKSVSEEIITNNNIITNLNNPINNAAITQGLGRALFGEAGALDSARSNNKSLLTQKKLLESQLIAQIEIDNADFFNKLQNEMDDLESQCTPGIYFYYGIGDNKDSWAGPVNVVLSNIQYLYRGDGDMRKLQLTYVANDAFFSPNSEKFFYRGLDRNVESFINFKDINIPNPTLHNLIKRSLSLFIAEVTRSKFDNVVVLFPDLDKGLGSLLEAEVKAVNGINESLPVGPIDVFQAMQRVLEKLTFNILVKPPVNEDSKFNGDYISAGVTIGALERNKAMDDLAVVIAKLEDVTKNTFIGLTLRERQTVQDILIGFETKLREYSSDSYAKIDIFYENDPAVKKVVAKYFNRPNMDLNAPLIIYGDLTFALNYFYGFVGVEGVKNTKNKTQVSPDDAALLNSDRIREMNSIFFRSEKQDGAFDPLFYSLPDDFAFLDENAKTKVKDNVTNLKLPVFIHGFENSNVLSLDINWGLQYFNAISDSFRPRISDSVAPNSVSNKSLNNAYTKLNDLNVAGIDETKIKDLINHLRGFTPTTSTSDTKHLKQLFGAYFPQLNSDVIDGLALEFLSVLKESNTGGIGLNYNEYIRNALPNKIANLMRKIYESSLIANVRTLPLFRFYNMHNSLHFPIYMFIREPSVVGLPVKRQIVASMLSGEWSIIGFKHHIGEDGIYSQFVIIRTPYASHANHTILKREEE